MLTLRHVRVWNTGETIDLIVGSSPNNSTLVEDHSVAEGSVDASGLTLATGLADPHVHFRDPGQTDRETLVTGCQAAASGGYTNVLIMPNTIPPIDGKNLSAESGMLDPSGPEARILAQGAKSVIDFLQHYERDQQVTLASGFCLSVCASMGRLGLEASNPDDWHPFVSGYRDFDKDAWQMAHPVVAISDDGSAVGDDILDQVLDNARRTGLPVVEHCEHHEHGAVNLGPVSEKLGLPGIDKSTEANIVYRDVEAVRRTGARVHFQHVSTAASFDIIREAKQDGLPVSCETAPHYLTLCDRDLLTYGTLAKMNPPLRSAEDRQAALDAVADGTVDMLATDHAPHTSAEKKEGLAQAPNGVIGLESAYGICHTALVEAGYISERRLVELMSTAPMALMGLETTDITSLLESFGRVDAVHGAHIRCLDLRQVPEDRQVGLSLLDTFGSWTIDPDRFHSKARNTPFGHWRVSGRPLATVIGSHLVFSRIPEDLQE